MRMIGSRRVVGGVVAVMLGVGGVFGVLAASSGARRPVVRPAAAVPMGGVTALAWAVRTPVAARLVLRPFVSFDLSPGALRMTNPRLSGLFVARIVTTPARGRAGTLVVLARRVNGLALGASVNRGRGVAFTAAARGILGRQLGLPRWVLTRGQTRAVKRAAARSALAITLSARYRVSYTSAGGRRVLTPTRTGSTTLPLGLRRQAARGGDLRKLAARFRELLGRAARLTTACVTDNTILEQLRNTYSAMVSGDRTAAAGLLQVYIDDAEMMGADGLLNHQQASMLGSGLGAILKRVGSGHSKRVESPRRWAALPTCTPPHTAQRTLPHPHTARRTPPRAHAAQTIATIIIRKVVKRVLKVIRRAAKGYLTYGSEFCGPGGCYSGGVSPPGNALTQLLESEWPSDTSQPDVAALVPPNDPTGVRPALNDFKAQIENLTSWEQCCLATNSKDIEFAWSSILNAFQSNKWRFQLSAYWSLTDKLDLLPLFTEYENMYLSVLREGVVNGPYWGMLPDDTLSVEDQIRNEISSGIAYSDSVYDAGLAARKSYPSDPEADFKSKNAYRRDMQLEVLDFRDLWHLKDPMGYPYGDPSFNENRIIYSDEVGNASHIYSPFSPPANPNYPLSSLTAWTTTITYSYHYDQNWLTAIQADNSPQVGVRTGSGSTGTASTHGGLAPGSTPGPVVQVDTTWDQKTPTATKIIGTVKFHFANKSTWAPGGVFYAGPSNPEYASDCCTTSWAYDDEVLAAVKIAGHYDMLSDKNTADALVLGFRQAESFSPHWNGSLPGPRRAPNTQACLAVEQVTITSGTHVGTATGSRADGAPLQMHDCNGGWEQNWQYVDYNDPNNPNDDATQRELSVYAGTKCMAPATDANGNWKTGGGFPTASNTTWPPPPHTLVAIYDCNGSDVQKWTINPDGTIRPANAPDLCLDRWNGSTTNGTPIQLYTCTDSTAQKWTQPQG